MIILTYSSIDGVSKTHAFTGPYQLAAAKVWAQRWLGRNAELGRNYAVSGDGIGKITVTGAELVDLFP